MIRQAEADRIRLQALADRAAADARRWPAGERCSGPAGGAMRAVDPAWPDDAEIIALVAEVYNLPLLDSIERLAIIDFAAARAALI